MYAYRSLAFTSSIFADGTCTTHCLAIGVEATRSGQTPAPRMSKAHLRDLHDQAVAAYLATR